MLNVAIFATHPIQYHVPWFRALHSHPTADITVYYEQIPSAQQQGEGFGTSFEWDIPLLDGYEWYVWDSRKQQSESEEFNTIRGAIAGTDVVLVTGWNASFLRQATFWTRATQTPIVVRGESNALRPRSWGVQLLHRAYLRLFDQFLCIGRANAEFYRMYGIPEDRLYSCRYFVENDRFDADYQSLRVNRSDIRRSFNIPSASTCYLFCGKFEEKKRPLDVLEAFRRVADRRDDVYLLMVGDGKLMGRAQAYADRHNLPVSFTGFLNQSEIGRAYTAADVLVLPSNYNETWGLVVNEAMVFECPAVVSDRVGCHPDLVSEGKTGSVFPFADVGALADSMVDLAQEPEKRAQMGKRAREHVLSKYTVEAAVEGTMDALQAAHMKDSQLARN